MQAVDVVSAAVPRTPTPEGGVVRIPEGLRARCKRRQLLKRWARGLLQRRATELGKGMLRRRATAGQGDSLNFLFSTDSSLDFSPFRTSSHHVTPDPPERVQPHEEWKSIEEVRVLAYCCPLGAISLLKYRDLREFSDLKERTDTRKVRCLSKLKEKASLLPPTAPSFARRC